MEKEDIIMIGNCQIERMSYVFRGNGIENIKYFANTEILDENFSCDKIIDHANRAPFVIAQCVVNENNPLNYRNLTKINRNTLIVPYIFVDGIFCLSASDVQAKKIYGEEYIQEILRDGNLGKVVEHFKSGIINFKNEERLLNSINDLKERERLSSSIEISEYINENIRDRRLLISHNHPTWILFDELCRKVFLEIGRSYVPYRELPHEKKIEYIFGRGISALSCYDVLTLGLQYDEDEQWFNDGFSMIRKICDDFKKRSYK